MKKNKREDNDILEEINNNLKNLVIAIAFSQDDIEKQIKILSRAGFSSNEIGKLIGMTGRGVRKNKGYK